MVINNPGAPRPMEIPMTQVFGPAASPVAWTDLDLSAVVGARVAIVKLAIQNVSGAGDNDYAVRRNVALLQAEGGIGGTDLNQVIDQHYAHFLTQTDLNGIIEWEARANTQSNVIVEAWWAPG